MGICSKMFPDLASFPGALPPYYGAVILTGCGAFALHMFFAKRVMKARKELNVPAPLLYSPTNEEFNCIQRSHQNYLEMLPFMLFATTVGGLRCPIVASVGGCLFLAGRYVFYRGYISGEPEKRFKGRFGCYALISTIIFTAFFGAQHLVASIRDAPCCYHLCD